MVLLTTFAFFQLTGYRESFSVTWFGSYYGFGLLALVALRYGLSVLVCRWTRQGRFERRTVIVGGGDPGAALIEQLRDHQGTDICIIGVFDDRGDERSSTICGGVPKLGKVDDLLSFARHTRVDLVIVALPVTAEERILQMVKKLWVLPIDIRLAVHRSKIQLRPRSYSYIGSVPLLDLADRPIANWGVLQKWLFDKIIGTLALVGAAPIMLLIALAIKLDSRGPILFKQRRYGFNNEIVEVYKFRSMYVEHTDTMARNIVTRNDPRVTRLGRFLRKTSLDELPQLFNVVFIGNMSLVGPRPHPLYLKTEGVLFNEAIDGYFARHRVKPGITGWAQINGWRGGVDTQEKIQRRVEHDLYYIDNWSIMFDIWILARTPFALLRSAEAY
jgi:Undecaprenyl-phosphate glucose phosphotransferase